MTRSFAFLLALLSASTLLNCGGADDDAAFSNKALTETDDEALRGGAKERTIDVRFVVVGKGDWSKACKDPQARKLIWYPSTSKLTDVRCNSAPYQKMPGDFYIGEATAKLTTTAASVSRKTVGNAEGDEFQEGQAPLERPVHSLASDCANLASTLQKKNGAKFVAATCNEPLLSFSFFTAARYQADVELIVSK